MELKGTIKEIYETKQINESFKVRKFVITDNNEDYPQYITFQLTQNRTALLDSINIGQSVIIKFNLKGKQWLDPDGVIKYFNSLEAYEIEFKPNKKEKRIEREEDDTLPF